MGGRCPASALHTALLRLGEWDEAERLREELREIPATPAERRRLERVRAALVREYRRAR